ncbi:MAG: sodium/glutamate symporter [Candidatus Fimivivens sp.]
MAVYHLMLDFSIASALILLGQFLRAKVPLFQKFFIPASMLAGFIGLALGAQGLKVLYFSDSAGGYAGILIIIIFTIVGINGFKFEGGSGAKNEAKRVVSFQLYRFLIFFIQFIIPIALTLTLIKVLAPEVNQGIGILMAAGFTGGHGTAAAVGKTFADLGWVEATDLGMTFATIGILTGIFGGLAFIKWATKKGYTGYIKDFSYISGDLKTGLISKQNRSSIGEDTISPVSLDTLCFHLSIVTAIAGAGYALNQFLLAPYVLKGIPDFTVAYLIALIVFVVFGKTKMYNYIDSNINQKISGTCTDYLVFFGIATIKITVIIEYALPLTILTAAGFLCVFLTMIPFGYRINKDSWFERSLFCYGYCCGVFAIGFVLLRIVDPNNKSKTIEDTAMTPFLNFIEIFFWSIIPALLISGKGWLVVGVVSLLTVVVIGLAIVGKMWYRTPLCARHIIGVDEITE